MKYRLVMDREGRPIHDSPPVAPWCPAIYEGPDGDFVFVGKALSQEDSLAAGIAVDDGEAAIRVSADHVARLLGTLES